MRSSRLHMQELDQTWSSPRYGGAGPKSRQKFGQTTSITWKRGTAEIEKPARKDSITNVMNERDKKDPERTAPIEYLIQQMLVLYRSKPLTAQKFQIIVSQTLTTFLYRKWTFMAKFYNYNFVALLPNLPDADAVALTKTMDLFLNRVDRQWTNERRRQIVSRLKRKYKDKINKKQLKLL